MAHLWHLSPRKRARVDFTIVEYCTFAVWSGRNDQKEVAISRYGTIYLEIGCKSKRAIGRNGIPNLPMSAIPREIQIIEYIRNLISILYFNSPAGLSQRERNGIPPWLVIISKNGNHACFGVLINRNEILTAAHCFWRPSKYACNDFMSCMPTKSW